MHRRLAILLALLLTSAASSRPVSAEQDLPPAVAESESVKAVPVEPPAPERSDRDLSSEGKYVRNILVTNLDVFGPSVEDTAKSSASRLERTLNNLNFQTRRTTIRRILLFKEGDPVDPFLMAESERLLRAQPFIGDARIVEVPIPGSSDSADVQITVKETWTLKLSANFKAGNRFNSSLASENLFGTGHQISVGATRNPDETPLWGFDASYFMHNIHRSFITGRIEYVRTPKKEITGLAFSRQLISPVFRYAGGMEMKRASTEFEDSLTTVGDNTSELIDIWTGRQFHLGHRKKGMDYRRIMFLSGRIRHLDFTKRPPVTPSTFSQYHDINHLLASLALIQIRHYRTTLLYDFGRTEDIPSGFLARLTYGLADEEFARYRYGAVSLAAGVKPGEMGYLVGEARMGGYPKRGTFDQGVIRLRSLYFSNLMHAGRFRFRQFVSAGYTAGIHRFTDDSIDFARDESIRGVTYDNSVTGSKRIQFSLEHVAFTPWTAKGVTCALFTFADLDIIGKGHESILDREYYSGVGLGIRLHKASFGIGRLQLRFAWYPRLPVEHSEFSFTGFGEKRFRPVEFLGGSPEIVDY